MVDEIRVPKSPLPTQLKLKREAREKADQARLSGTPAKETPPVNTPVPPVTTPAPVAPAASVQAPPAQLIQATPPPEPIAQPASTPPALEPPVPVAPPAPLEPPTPSPAPIPAAPATPEVPKEGIVPIPAPVKAVGPKEGETPEKTIKRISAALTNLQGKYNAEIPNLMRETAKLNKENAELKTANEKLTAEHGRLTSENESLKKQPVQPVSQELSADEKTIAKNLGIEHSDYIALKTAILSGVPKPQELPIVKAPEPKPVEPAPEHAPEPRDPARDAYIETLDALIGGSEVRDNIISDPKFAEFLDLYDAVSKKPIRSLAQTADSAKNSYGMAEIYSAFLDWRATPAPVTTEVPKPTSQLMPTPKSGGIELKSNQKPLYTEAQYDEFKRKIVRGDFRTIGKTAEEAKKITEYQNYWSEEFRTAKMEGRIIAAQE